MPRQPKSKRVDLRVSEQMLTMLDQQASEAGMTRTRYITYLIEREHKARQVAGEAPGAQPEGVPVIIYRDADLRKIEWLLAKWGNNLNQAASALNTLADKQFPSEIKSQILIEQSAQRIGQSETAITRIAYNIGKLREARHIVMDDVEW